MSPKVREIFTRAAVLPAGEREAFLAEACGSDAELRLEVQRLLVDAERADSFLGEDEDEGGHGDRDGDETVGVEEFEERYSEQEGDVVGVYTLRQKIGEGGFGVVWMAEQSQPISRMVALKVVKAGMDTRQVLARFEAERQALAMMDHPNIAKVLDAGATSSGRPYFAMELVKGVPVTEFCDDQKYGPRERLELFKDVCSAVNHAHQKGIIHRDLKPSNVMVTLAADKPVVKVIDFGIAKATHSKLTEKTLFTRFEQFLGTPVYMSPEQAAMSAIDVDTRSDIYSLGVLLYELLVGAPPFDAKSLLSAGYDEMRRIIREDEPAKPSTKATQTQAQTATGDRKKILVTASTLRGELDWIVMKAIEKDRTRRYETANAFAVDIGRYLADEPVQAAAPGAAYKFRKFARRNKAGIGVAAAMLVLLLGGIAATSWQAVRATAEAERATAAEALAGQRLDEAEAARAQAEEDREKALTARSQEAAARADAEATSNFLTGMFASSEPGAEKGGREVKVVDVLDRAAEQLDADTAMPPKRRAAVQGSLGRTYYSLGLYSEAIRFQEKARDFHLATSGPEHPDTLKAMASLAFSYIDADRPYESLEMREEVLALNRKVNGPEHPDTLGAMLSLASSYFMVGRRDEALEMEEEVLELSRKVNGPEHPDTLRAMHALATSYDDASRRGESLEIREEALALRRKVNGPEHPGTLGAMTNLAISYEAAGRLDEALEMREEVLALNRKVNGPEHPDTLGAMTELARSYKSAGRIDEAVRLQEESLAIKRRVLPPGHRYIAVALSNMAELCQMTGRPDDALEMQEEVLPLWRMVLGPEHPVTLGAMYDLVKSYYDAGRRDESLETCEDVLALSRKVDGSEHPDTLGAMTNLAFLYKAAGRIDEAIKLQEESLAIKRRVLPPGHPHMAVALNNMAELCQMTGREAEARALREEAAALHAKREVLRSEGAGLGQAPAPPKTRDPSTTTPESNGGPADATGGAAPGPARPGQAKTKEIEFLEDVLSSTQLAHDEDHEYTLAAKAKLAAALRANGNVAEAGKLEKEIAASEARTAEGGNQ